MNLKAITAAGVWGVGAGLAIAPFIIDASRRDSLARPEIAEAVAERVRAEVEVGDCIVVRPSWFSWPLSRLVGTAPGTEAWPFEALFRAEDPDPVGLGACSRVWWMAFQGAEVGPSPLDPADIEGAGETLGSWKADADGAELRRYVLKTNRRLRTLTRELAGTKVFRGARDSEGARCRWRGEKHRCGTDGWLDVGLESRHVAHDEVHWVFAHPGPRGDVLRIVWDDMEADAPAAVTLIVRAGFSMEAVRRMEGSPVTLEVWVDGSMADTITMPPREWVLHRRVWTYTTRDGRWPSVEFRISADEPGWREVMLEADFVERMSPTLERWLKAD